MAMAEVYINDKLMDTSDEPIAVTYQANDLGDISSRQVNFSTTIEMPKTEKNIANMNLLGVPGSTSLIPYRKAKGKIVDGGIELISSGVSKINETKTSTAYKVAIYDEPKDLFEFLGEKLLSELDFGNYNHPLIPASYIGSFDRTSHYIYADGVFFGDQKNVGYNFKMPALFVHSLVRDILAQAGYTFEGEIFTDESFLRQVVTPTRGFLNNVQTFPGTLIQFVEQPNHIYVVGTTPFVHARIIYSLNLPIGTLFRISGTLLLAARLGSGNLILRHDNVVVLSISATNQTVTKPFNQLIFRGKITVEITGNSVQSGGSHFLDLLSIIEFTIASEFIHPVAINFSNMFGEQTQLDFLKEIMVLNNIFVIKKGRESHLIFLQMDKVLLDRAGAEDWSEKFVEQTSEAYDSGYARRNIFTYKYESDVIPFADGVMQIDNENLPEGKVAHNSIFTAPRHLFGLPAGSYWEIETVDEIETIVPRNESFRIYDIHYSSAPFYVYFAPAMGAIPVPAGTQVPFLRLRPMGEFVTQNYSAMKTLLDRYKRVVCNFNLSLLDVNALDFGKLKYVNQLGKFFYLNKINNYLSASLSNCELIEAPTLIPLLDVIPPTNIAQLWADDITTTTLLLRWTASFDTSPILYEVFRDGILLGQTATLLFFVSGLNPNTGYLFGVRAKDAAGNFSALRTRLIFTAAMPVDVTPPAAPTGLVVGNITSTSFELSWVANVETDLNRYEIFLNNELYVSVLPPLFSLIITALLPNTTYSIFIIAVDHAGNSSLPSATITTKTHARSFMMDSIGHSTSEASCQHSVVDDLFFHDGVLSLPAVNDVIYTNAAATAVFRGNDLWYKTGELPSGYALQINADGKVVDKITCGGGISPA